MDEPYDGVSPALEDLVALFEAGSAEELWRELLMGGGLPSSPNSWDAGLGWRHHHGDGQAGAIDTALLLCTDRRWGRDTARLIATISSSGLLDPGGRAELARRFLGGMTMIWPAPVEWSEGPWIDIPLGPAEDVASELLAVGLSWGRGSVRLVALERLAEREGADVARLRAAGDPDTKVRQWAEKLGRPARSSPARRGPSRPDADKPTIADTDTQPSLFDL